MKHITFATCLLALFILAGCATTPRAESGPYAHLVNPHVDLSAARGNPDALAYIHRHYMVEMADNDSLNREDWERQYFGDSPSLNEAANITSMHTKLLKSSPEIITEHFEESSRMHLSAANTFFLTGQWNEAWIVYDAYLNSLESFMPHLSTEQQATATEHQVWVKEKIADAIYAKSR